MKRKIFIIAIVVIVIIATAVLVKNLRSNNGGGEVHIPEGSKVIGSLIVPPEDIELFNAMGEMFANNIPLENIESERLESDNFLEDVAESAARELYRAGIREIAEIEIYKIIGSISILRVEDIEGDVYYIDIRGGFIFMITRDNIVDGEVVFAIL